MKSEMVEWTIPHQDAIFEMGFHIGMIPYMQNAQPVEGLAQLRIPPRHACSIFERNGVFYMERVFQNGFTHLQWKALNVTS